MFHNFGYKVIQLKEVTENKAMQEEGGVQCMTGGKGFKKSLPPSPVQWLHREREESRYEVHTKTEISLHYFLCT